MTTKNPLSFYSWMMMIMTLTMIAAIIHVSQTIPQQNCHRIGHDDHSNESTIYPRHDLLFQWIGKGVVFCCCCCGCCTLSLSDCCWSSWYTLLFPNAHHATGKMIKWVVIIRTMGNRFHYPPKIHTHNMPDQCVPSNEHNVVLPLAIQYDSL